MTEEVGSKTTKKKVVKKGNTREDLVVHFQACGTKLVESIEALKPFMDPHNYSKALLHLEAVHKFVGEGIVKGDQ